MNEGFDKAFEFTIGVEGGYVNDPSDPGGETKFGVSKKSYPNLDIKNLTITQAKEIYYKDYWIVNQNDMNYLVRLVLYYCPNFLTPYKFESKNGQELPYWRDIGTLDSYFSSNIDLISISH